MGQVITAFTGLPCRVGGVKREPLAIFLASEMSAGCVLETVETYLLRPDGKMATRTTTRPLLAPRILRGKVTDGLLISCGLRSSSPREYSDLGIGGDGFSVGRDDSGLLGFTTGLGRGLTITGSGDGG